MGAHSKKDGNVADLNAPDEALIEATRKGSRTAFAELWRRHYRSGITVAHSFTSLDADDLVSEAFARIYKRTIEGGGPRGAFRPYLYTTIRNLASTWGTAESKIVQVDDLETLHHAEPGESADEPAARTLDRDLTAQAYRSLPDRWQTVLWYTEVESLDPSEVAPLLGMTANGVAALAYRAREGLRKAWLQAHVSDASATGACAWVIERLGERSRHSLTDRESQRIEAHIVDCAKCRIVSQEVDEVGSRLAFVLFPLLLGTVAAGTLLGSAAGVGAGSASAAGIGAGAAAATVPALPAAIGSAAAGGGAAASATSFVAVAASTVIVAAVGAGAVGVVQVGQQSAAAAEKTISQPGALADPLGIGPTSAPASIVNPTSTAVDPSTIPPATPTVVTIPTPQPTNPAPKPTASTGTGTTGGGTGTGTGGGSGSGAGLGGTVTKTGQAVTGTVDKTVTGVGKVVKGVTGAVNGVVDGVVAPGSGLNNTLDTVTGTVDGLTDTVTDTVGSVTDVVGGLVGGLGGLLGH